MPALTDLTTTRSNTPLDEEQLQYMAQAYKTAPLATSVFANYARALDTPSETQRLRDNAKQYISQAAGIGSDIGRSGGLTGSEWGSLAGLLGGGQHKGKFAGVDMGGSALGDYALMQAQAAQLENEYQKQRAQSLSQYGQIPSERLTAQNIADYNQALPVNALANPQVAAQIQSIPFEQSIRATELANRTQLERYLAGMRPEATEVSVPASQEPGARVGSSTGGLAPVEPRHAGIISQFADKQNEAKNNQFIQNYSTLQTKLTPEVVAQKQQSLNNTLQQLTTDSSLWKGDTFDTKTIDPAMQAELKQALKQPDTVTSGYFGDLAKRAGISTQTAAVMSALSQISDVPGYEDQALKFAEAIANGKQFNKDMLNAAMQGAQKQYETSALVTPNMKKFYDMRGASDLPYIKPEALQATMIEKGYGQPLGSVQRVLAQKYGLPTNEAVGNVADAIRGSGMKVTQEQRNQIVNDIWTQVRQANPNVDIKKRNEIKSQIDQLFNSGGILNAK